jgi:hypothetical protein
VNRSAGEKEVAQLKVDLGLHQGRLGEARGLAAVAKKLGNLGTTTPPPLPQNGHANMEAGASNRCYTETDRGAEDRLRQACEARFAEERRDLHQSLARKLRSLEALYQAQKAEMEKVRQESSADADKGGKEEGQRHLTEADVAMVRHQWEQAWGEQLRLQQQIRDLREREEEEEFIFKGKTIVLEEMRDYLEVRGRLLGFLFF